MRKIALLLATVFPLVSFAQSALTIFSEDGDKFYLVLNGQRQNNVAQTNIHIDGLTQPYYAVKVIFEDKAKPEISKNIPVQDPQTNANADVTYKIKRTKDGDLKIRYFSATPVAPNYVAPPDMYVMHFGAPAVDAATTVTQTTTTTTTGSNNGSAGLSMNVGGAGLSMNVNVNDQVGNGSVSMNVNMGDPGMNATSTTHTTTTTRTTSSYSSSSSSSNYDNQPVRQQGCNYAMDMGSFNSAKKTIADASFEETKLSTAKTILGSNCFSTNQVVEVCKLFSFEQSKLDFAKYAYSKCTDRGNYFKVASVFSFDASKSELNEYITNNQ